MIMDAIRKRVVEAHEKKQKFRVIIVLPQKPEFAGEYFSMLYGSYTYYSSRKQTEWLIGSYISLIIMCLPIV